MEAAIHDDGQLMTYVDVTAPHPERCLLITATDISRLPGRLQSSTIIPFRGRDGSRRLPERAGLFRTFMTPSHDLRAEKCWIRRDGRPDIQKATALCRAHGRPRRPWEWYAPPRWLRSGTTPIPRTGVVHRTIDEGNGVPVRAFTCADVGYVDAHTYFSQQGLDWASLDDEIQLALASVWPSSAAEAYADSWS